MICGMSVEVAGTEHVATARFDVASSHIEIGFGSFLLRGRGEIDETYGERKQRKQKESRQTKHDSSYRFIWNGARPGMKQLYSRSLEDSTGFPFEFENCTSVHPSCRAAVRFPTRYVGRHHRRSDDEGKNVGPLRSE
jgi:hypothetical protein